MTHVVPTITIPEPLADIVVPNHDPTELQRWGLQSMVLTAYCDNQITTGDAAQLLSMGYFQFLDLVKERGVPYVITEEEFEVDQAEVRSMLEELRNES